MRIENFGQTPALNLVLNMTVTIVDKGKVIAHVGSVDNDDLGQLAPRDNVKKHAFMFLKKTMHEKILSRDIKLCVDATATFTDVFDARHELRTKIESFDTKSFGFVVGSRQLLIGESLSDSNEN